MGLGRSGGELRRSARGLPGGHDTRDWMEATSRSARARDYEMSFFWPMTRWQLTQVWVVSLQSSTQKGMRQQPNQQPTSARPPHLCDETKGKRQRRDCFLPGCSEPALAPALGQLRVARLQ
jgi:hypothetical protein